MTSTVSSARLDDYRQVAPRGAVDLLLRLGERLKGRRLVNVSGSRYRGLTIEVLNRQDLYFTPEAFKGKAPDNIKARQPIHLNGKTDFDESDGVLLVRLGGTCHGCSASTITLKQGIESRLREAVPEVKHVEAV